MTSNTALPQVKSSTHGSTFQSVFDGASRQSSPTQGSTDLNAKAGAGDRKEAEESSSNIKAGNQQDTHTPSGPNIEGNVSADGPVSGDRWQPVSAELYAGSASIISSDSPLVLPASLMAASPIFGGLPMTPVAVTEGSATLVDSVNSGAKPLAKASAPSPVASKNGKLKAPTVHDNAGLLAALVAAIADAKIAPVPHTLSAQGSVPGQAHRWAEMPATGGEANAPKDIPATSAEASVGVPDASKPTKTITNGLQRFDPTLAAQGPGESLIAAKDIPLASGPSSNVKATSAGGKALQKGAFEAIGSPKAGPPISLNVEKGVLSGSKSASYHGAQTEGQATQGSKGDPTKPTTAPGNVPDSFATQLPTQIVAMHAASHATAEAPQVPMGSAELPRAAGAPHVPAVIRPAEDEPVVSSGINGAKVIQAMGGSEMRVGMHSTEFGDISIRTTISQQQMVTQISLSHHDLSQAISAHVATVQAKLGDDYGLRASIEINNQTPSFSSDPGSSSRQEQQSFAGSARTNSGAILAVHDNGIGLGMMGSAGDQYGLDIRI